ncbi:MAG: XRE family transcriptional regulator [Chloroflexi bacterium]|nr:XRE family transcriptional regulator [Chloroflexota bacterium]
MEARPGGHDAAAVGALLKRFRLRAGLSQEALADRAGLSPAAIGALEQGSRRRPRPYTLSALAVALTLSEAELEALQQAAERARHPTTSSEPAPTTVHHLPNPPTALIGREAEVQTVVDLLTGSSPPVRLLTLLGPGGVGKSRLAIEIARVWGTTYRDAVTFVDLEPVRDERLVPATIAWSLGIHEASGQSAHELLVAHLAAHRLLLVLDGAEHLAGAFPWLATLLERCACLTLMVTSRVALRLRAERRLPVGPLPTPPASAVSTEQVVGSPAVQLFLERARATVPSFTLDSSNVAAVSAICRQLDGLPLAIELAAPRMMVLEPTVLLGRLEHRLATLTSAGPDVPHRQRTLRSTLAWSYDLLEPTEQRLFRRLGVFVGGCTLDAIEHVCSGGPLSGEALIEALSSLLDKSLIRRAEDPQPQMRFEMLETIREYATEQLSADGEREALHRRHLDWCLSVADRVPSYALDPAGIADLQREQSNLRAALRFAIDRRDADSSLRLADGMYPLWYVGANYAEGRAWLAEVLALAREPSALRARTFAWDGQLAGMQADFAVAESRLHESLTMARTIDDQLMVAIASHLLGQVARDRGDLTGARARYQQALLIEVALGNRLLESFTLEGLASIAEREGDLTALEAWAAEALRLHRAFGHTWDAAHSLDRRLASAQGDSATARRLLEDSLPLQRTMAHRGGLGASLFSLARLAQSEGDTIRASQAYAEGLGLAEEVGQPVLLLRNLDGVATLLAESQPTAAARIAGAAAALRSKLGVAFLPHERERLERALAPVRERLGTDTFESLWQDGTLVPLAQVAADARRLVEARSPPL